MALFSKREISPNQIEAVTSVTLKLRYNGWFKGELGQSIESVRNELKHILLHYLEYRLIPNGVVTETVIERDDLPCESSRIIFNRLLTWEMVKLNIPDRLELKLFGSDIKQDIEDMLLQLKNTNEPLPAFEAGARVFDHYGKHSCLIQLPYATIHASGDTTEALCHAFNPKRECSPVYMSVTEFRIGTVVVSDLDRALKISEQIELLDKIYFDIHKRFPSLLK